MGDCVGVLFLGFITVVAGIYHKGVDNGFFFPLALFTLGVFSFLFVFSLCLVGVSFFFQFTLWQMYDIRASQFPVCVCQLSVPDSSVSQFPVCARFQCLPVLSVRQTPVPAMQFQSVC